MALLGANGAGKTTVIRTSTGLLGMSGGKLNSGGVSFDGRRIDGIVSERDLAYALAAHGSDLPALPVSKMMTKAVVVCSPEDTITHVMKLMTQLRVRHVPVKDGDKLVGIVSIGDVLKHRLDELELEANVMRDYAVAARH